jgi:hypothetical protein
LGTSAGVKGCLTQSVEQLTSCLLGLGRGIRGPQLSKQLHIAQHDRLDATRHAEEVSCRVHSRHPDWPFLQGHLPGANGDDGRGDRIIERNGSALGVHLGPGARREHRVTTLKVVNAIRTMCR